MPHWRQNTLGTWKAGPFMDQTSGTGTVTDLVLTPDLVRLSKNGANYAAKTHPGTAAHDEGGEYDVVIGTGDVDTLGILKAKIHVGALPVWERFEVIEQGKYDWLYGTNNIEQPSSGTVGLAIQINTNADKTGYTVSAGTVDRAVSAGTIDRANSVPFQNPTGGTVDLAVEVTTVPASNPTGGTIDLAVAINTNADKTGYTISGGTADQLLNLNDKTGFDLNADQSAVSIGTTGRANSVPNPTGGTVDAALNASNPSGGTVDLAIQVNQGTVDAALNAANPSGGTVDLAIQVNTIDNVGTVAVVLANDDKTGYNVTGGTVDRANSIPASNPSGGTVDLAIEVTTIPNPTGGTMDLVTNAGTLLQTLSRGEPGQGVPPAATDSFTKNDYLYKLARNKKDNNGTVWNIYADNATTVDQKSTLSSDGTTATIGELTTGA